MCSVWISEQTAIISLYSVNWLVFITETECVYCAVRAGPFNIMQVDLNFQHVWHRRIFVSIRYWVNETETPCKNCGLSTYPNKLLTRSMYVTTLWLYYTNCCITQALYLITATEWSVALYPNHNLTHYVVFSILRLLSSLSFHTYVHTQAVSRRLYQTPLHSKRLHLKWLTFPPTM
jgi:hypothetical protein